MDIEDERLDGLLDDGDRPIDMVLAIKSIYFMDNALGTASLMPTWIGIRLKPAALVAETKKR